MLDVTSLKPGDTIVVRSKEETERLLSVLQDAGYHWTNGRSPLNPPGLTYGPAKIKAVSIHSGKLLGYWETEQYLIVRDKSQIYSLDDLCFSPAESEVDIPDQEIGLSDYFGL